jgi:DegV family protein with EDD domain
MIYNKITVYTNIYNMYGGLVMSDYIISCCSTADLTEEHFNKRDIHYICFHYELDRAAYMDDLGKTINLDDFYKAMSEGADTKTSQINVDEYETYFEEFLKEGKDILHLTLSSGISGTINSANIAAETLKEKYPDRKIYVIDSLAASSGYGLLMDKVADLKDEGMGIDELKDWVIENRLKVNHWFFTTDLTFFIKGGRVSKVSGFVGNLLNICPLLNVNFEGKLIPREKIRTKKKVIAATVEKMINNAENGLDYDGKCYISMSACRKDAEAVAKLIEEKFPKLNGRVEINNIGTTIGSHTGPGTVALFFWGNKRVD